MRNPLPTVDGIGPSRVRVPAGPWKNILEYLEDRFPKVKSATWISRMKKGDVVDEYGIPLNAESPCRKGTFIYYYRELENEAKIPFEEGILYQDDHILVADKPHFLPVMPSGRFLRETLLVRLKKRFKIDDLVPLHRIDRETAGIVMFSCNPETRRNYASLFTNHEVRKVYEALASTLPGGHFPIIRRSCLIKGEPFFRMKEVEGIPNSETVIDLEKNFGVVSLYRLVPVTGRQHQLRIHCAALGIPIINDTLYPEIQHRKEDDFSSPLQLLAKSITLRDPLTGQDRHFESDAKLETRIAKQKYNEK